MRVAFGNTKFKILSVFIYNLLIKFLFTVLLGIISVFLLITQVYIYCKIGVVLITVSKNIEVKIIIELFD